LQQMEEKEWLYMGRKEWYFVLGSGTKAAAAQEAGGGLGGDETVLLG
jgi:hypothetical protein